MSEFSKYLTKLKDKRNLTSAALAELCGMNKVTIWQWMEGRNLPEDWRKLEPVLEQLRPMQEERSHLKDLLEYEVEGKEQCEIYHAIKDILRTLSEKREEFFSENKVLYQKLGGGNNCSAGVFET